MTLREGTALRRRHVSELIPCCYNCSENLSHQPPLWIIFHSYVWVSDSLFTWTLGRRAKIIWLGVKNCLYFCCLQCSDSVHFNKLLTMHEFESEELEERLGWHALIIGFKGMIRHLLFPVPTILKSMPLLLWNWIVLIRTGHKQLGITWCFPLRGFKSEVMLEFISKFCLTQISSTFCRVWALEGFFPTQPLEVCTLLCRDISWSKRGQTRYAVLFF